jgi:hypothetical protein
MNTSIRILDPTVRDSGYGKLALLGLCIAFLTFAIAKQLPAHAAEQANTPSHGQEIGR